MSTPIAPGNARFLATFDVEDWFHAANVLSSLPSTDPDALEPRLEPNANELLDILADAGARSTFFVLGWVAERYPAIVRRIVDEGHELASHTHLHRNLRELPRAQVEAELARAKDALEQVGRCEVRGVRAPNFSVSDEVLDVLAEAGYWYDSSYFGFEQHDRYGRISTWIDPTAPVVEVRPRLLEIQMTRLPVGPVMVPWAGGAYFRLIPYPLFRRGVAERLRKTSWFTFYFHPWELDPEEVPPTGMRRSLRFRAYTGRRRTRRDLRRLVSEFGSSRIDESLLALGYAPPGTPPRGPTDPAGAPPAS
ncbi:MAG TPA: polysaccharide deacetylase family protein [Actinomycetota bacterium]|nr:polysaccharide deacetylase family protein [Actinomycetota bacterium]